MVCKDRPYFALVFQSSFKASTARSIIPRESDSDCIVGYLQCDDVSLLLVQEGQSLRMLFPEQIASDPGLELGHQRFIGQPQLFSVIVCSNRGDDTLTYREKKIKLVSNNKNLTDSVAITFPKPK